MHSFVQQVEVCETCEDYSHFAYDYPYYPQYENYHYSGYASPQLDFFRLMSSPQFLSKKRALEYIDEEELCSTHPEEDVSVDSLKNFEVNEVTQVEDYWSETVEGRVAGEAQIESEEDQPLVLLKPPTLSCTFVKPYKGVEVRERSHIFYTADTFVLDDPDATDFFILEVPNELRNLKEGMHASLPKYVDAPFVVDISKGEGIA
ncbi:hypothetical protein Scep_030234 [Stephania cephalantha]|uniref:Uncharacterized protein n=1 Tax=Stephania cephalantha TaxID=152367 RepID=A0AAP0E2H4_9MAGN